MPSRTPSRRSPGINASGADAEIVVVPATPSRWAALEGLFGPRGACAGCWCMWWRREPKTWRDGKGNGNRAALRRRVQSSKPAPGLLAMAGDRAVGWCALAPRQEYPRLDRSRILALVDATPVWAVTCFFVASDWRRRGLTVRLIRAAADFARSHGARHLEGYPVDTRGRATASAFIFPGTASAFQAAGFREVARRSATRPIVRLAL